MRNKLQPQYSVHSAFEKSIFYSDKYPKRHFGGLGIGFTKSSLEQIGRANPHSKGICIHSILVERVSNYVLPSIIVSVAPQNVNQFGLLRFLHCTPTLSEEYQNCFKNYSQLKLQENMRYGHVSQFLFLKNRLKLNNYQKPLVRYLKYRPTS